MNPKIDNKLFLIGGLLIIGAVLLTGAGTFAYLSDVETSGTNLFTTDIVDMAVSGSNPWAGTFSSSLSDLKLGMTSWGNITLSNVGQNPMDVWLQIRNVETAEGTVTEPESLETAAYDIDGVCRYGLIPGAAASSARAATRSARALTSCWDQPRE